MFSEINSFLEFFENMNKKKILIVLAGILIIFFIAWISKNVDIQVIDDYYKQENGNYYKIYSEDNVKWDKARMECSKRGGHLATITDRKEQEIISGLLGDQCYWIGAMKDIEGSDWRWVTDEPFVYTNWANGEPSNTAFKENVIMLYSHGSWNDINSEVTSVSFQGGYKKSIYYICEWEHKINFIVGKNENFHSFGVF